MNSVAHSMAEASPAITTASINQHQQPQPPPSPSPSQPTSVSETAPTPSLPSISSPSAQSASLPAVLAAATAVASVSAHSLPQNPDELPPLRQPSPTSPAHYTPTIQDIAPSLAAAGRPLSPAAITNVQALFTHDTQEMDIDSGTPGSNQPGRPPLSDARIRTPLPSGPRLEKSLSLPGIESFKNDLQTNVGRMLSTPSRDRYISVQVIFLFWQDDEDVPTIQSAVRELAEVFDKYYRYNFQVQAIPSSSEGCKSSWRWLSRQLNEFVEDRDERDVLKIVYYAGHTYLDSNREMVLASSRDSEQASPIRWGGIQQTLEEACADTLIIMDAAYYPSTRMIRQQGVLELLAASVSEEHFYDIDRCAFTRALAEQLRIRAARLSPLSAAELHANLFSHYSKMVQDKHPEKEVLTSFPSPLHMMMSGNSRLPSIFLSPVYENSPMRTSFSSYENSPQLHLSIRLDDDNVDIESWNEWLRLMPEGIKDIKVEGPFRATFR
uniref:Tyrosine-protein phosphatase non-receptor type 6 n=1 Tax=Gibberella zeae (strain ATCC MYA-4620 / CBS 123657 / FGSC 9075 / NRRL 31084 / PH-1) TaxID=229533 RepID=A0A098D4Z7_GIBZE